MEKEVFNRYELKYLIHEDVYLELLKSLRPYLSLDTNGDQDGYYTVASIYYDTEDNLFHQEKMKGQQFRQKLRMRTYNKPSLNDYAFIEIKKKHKNVVNKRRTLIRLKDSYGFLADKQPMTNPFAIEASNRQILKEIDFLKCFYQLQPKVVLAYERQAFQATEDKSIRITFDKNLRKREYNFRLENGSDGEIYVDPQLYVLEVKLSERMPLWLARILSEFRCAMQSFSKYSSCYSNTDIPVVEKNII